MVNCLINETRVSAIDILLNVMFSKHLPSRFSRDGDPISFACPKEIGERKRHPTPRPSDSLRYSVNKASAELALTGHTLRGLSRCSDRSSTKPPCSLPLLGAATGDGAPSEFGRLHH